MLTKLLLWWQNHCCHMVLAYKLFVCSLVMLASHTIPTMAANRTQEYLGLGLELNASFFRLEPPSVNQLIEDHTIFIRLNVSRSFQRKLMALQQYNYTSVIHVMPMDADIAFPQPHPNVKFKMPDSHTQEIAFNINPSIGSVNQFSVTGLHVGRTTFKIHILILNSGEVEDTVELNKFGVSIVRKQRLVDIAFNTMLSVITLLNSYAIGCLTDLGVVKTHFHRPLVYRVVLGACSQFVVMPLMAFALAQILSLEPGSLHNNLALGLLFVSCIPGGGMGHLLVIIIGNADKELSMAMNLISTTAVIVIAPIWVYSLGQFFPSIAGTINFPFFLLEACLISVVVPYLLGLLTLHCKPAVAEAMLTWVIRPLLLLAAILFVTLGIYINMYMFDVIDKFAIIAGISLPFLGFGTGGFLAIIARQKKPIAKTLATETALSNCALALLTLRFTLEQPDADVISTMAMWVLLFSPLPFVLLLIVHKIKKSILEYYNKRKETQEQHMMLLASFASMTKNMADISGLATMFKKKADENGDVDVRTNDRRESVNSEDGTIAEEPSTAQSIL